MKKKAWLIASLVLVVVLAGGLVYGLNGRDSGSGQNSRPFLRIGGEDGLAQTSHQSVGQDLASRNSSNKENPASAAEEQYDNRAFPNTSIAVQQQQNSYTSFMNVARLPGGKQNNWQPLGPVNPIVDFFATYTLGPSVTSGRVTALALAPGCHASDCKILVGAAGGGVWAADNALASQPNWHPASNGIPSNAIGSLLFDPTDPKGNTVYVGTGEPNGSSDSEAGVGLYKSMDGGKSWALVPGSFAVSQSRSIGAVSIDPANANHLYIGTAVARHGSSSSNGGRFTPPGAPKVGLYESLDGGQTFSLVFSEASDTVSVGTPNGNDFFRGGVTNIQFSGSTIYFSMFDYGLFRSKAGGGFEVVFASAGGGNPLNTSISRTEFSLAPLPNGNLRIYLGDTDGGPADFYRVDNANVTASTLTDGVNNPGWLKLSNSNKGTPGYGSYNYCSEQCWYDMPVYSPSGAPDIVYIGGQMQYGELFRSSNGRAVQRSTDAGVHFTDMTSQADNLMGLHPDQHALVSPPDNPNIVFSGSDGGVIRTSGNYVDASAQCAARGLSGADMVDCQMWFSAVPAALVNINNGLNTLQFQSVSINAQNPLKDIIGGTQDNGTWGFNGQGAGSWLQFIGGDGGQSGVDAGNPNLRMHTYFGPQPDVNFKGNTPSAWDWIGDVLGTEAASFYVPLINDPKVSGSWFIGQARVWRTQDSGGDQAFLDKYCNEFFGDYAHRPNPCGDWVPLGKSTLTGSAYGTDKSGSYVVALARTASDSSTLWVGTRRGRLFISKNADAANNAVSFTRLDTAAQPTRFISGIAVDPANPNHAWISYSGYDAYDPIHGHVFNVVYNPTTGTAAFTDLSKNIGDQPVTGLAFDSVAGDLFIATDFGVAMLANGSSMWTPAAGSLPPVAVYGLTIDSNARVLYAATHGRGIYKLDLSK